MRRLWVVLLAAGCGPAAEIDGPLFVPAALTAEDAGVRTATTSTRRDAGPRDASPIDAGDPTCPEPTLESVRDRVFLTSCATSGCHTGPQAAQGLALDTLQLDLVSRLRQSAAQSPSSMPLVTPGQPGASYLYLKVFLPSPSVGDRMPPSAPLSACQLAGLRRWIEAGAP